MLKDLADLIRIDSTRGEAKPGMPYGEGPAAAVAAAGEMMERYGLRVTDYDSIMIAGDLGPVERELDIIAHLDVVPVSEDWTVTAPFEPKVTDGKIYGRGAIDDKGPAVAALYALRCVKELGIPLKKGVRLLLGSNEECGSSDLRYYFQREKPAPHTFSPDGDFPLINIEKARLAGTLTASWDKEEEAKDRRLVLLKGGSKANVVPSSATLVVSGVPAGEAEAAAAEAGTLTGAEFTVDAAGEETRISVRGVPAHGSRPSDGVNAATAAFVLVRLLALTGPAAQAALSLGELFPHGDTEGRALGVAMSDELSGALTMNLGVVSIADGELVAKIDCRAPLCATDENLTDVFLARLSSFGIAFSKKQMAPAHHVPEDDPFVKDLLACYESWTGEKGRPLAIGGWTYVHNIPGGVAFGCDTETDHHMHGDDEFVETGLLAQSAKMFADAVVRICGEEE